MFVGAVATRAVLSLSWTGLPLFLPRNAPARRNSASKPLIPPINRLGTSDALALVRALKAKLRGLPEERASLLLARLRRGPQFFYFADGRADQGEKTLRDLMANPTVFVSADQATISLARFLAPKKPAEARKLLEPLRSRTGNVGQLALTLMAEIPQ